MGAGGKERRVFEDAVEYLCRNAGALRDLVGATRWDGPFALVRDGDPATGAWHDAVRALHEAAEDAGIPGGIGLRTTMGVGDWPGGPTPRSVGWICPTGRCARVDLPDDAPPDAVGPDNAPPDARVCALSGGPLRRVD
ncbi:hypothetical protein [Streptomyces sp. BE303]|uniref:hypothetical protein n=1 Tax=Streptomyces sp. BE303 TaxID=3002528 RepID=UPI002E75D46B|nr:hypothetical protein [Streptomyces sp. BE303]MED7948414.1 hypothetical protein [Streptomyces sp. BE303]